MTYPDSVDELLVADGAITVLVKLVVHAGELLGGHEGTKFGAHLLELELVQSAGAVEIVVLHAKRGELCDSYVEDLLQLKEIVDTLGVELELKLVSDLLEAVFPVHLYERVCFIFLILNKALN